MFFLAHLVHHTWSFNFVKHKLNTVIRFPQILGCVLIYLAVRATAMAVQVNINYISVDTE